MYNDYKKVLNILSKLNIPIENPKYRKPTRIFFQKFVYILKKMGIHFESYNDFNFHLNGMYSPDLTKDYYSFHEDVMNKPFDISLDENESVILEKYRNYIFNHRLFTKNPIELHESVSTIIYLKEEMPESNEIEIINRCKLMKSHLSRKILTKSMNIVKKMEYKGQYLTEDIKNEINLWNSVDD